MMYTVVAIVDPIVVTVVIFAHVIVLIFAAVAVVSPFILGMKLHESVLEAFVRIWHGFFSSFFPIPRRALNRLLYSAATDVT